MARAKSPEKRRAILEAAVCEIADSGLGASTASIAARAGVASGTLFTYFASKEELLNELYLELKAEVYRRINDGFPAKASLERRAWHVWSRYLLWALDTPHEQRVSLQLNLASVVTAATRQRMTVEREAVQGMLEELDARMVSRGLPEGFAGATMLAMQEAVLEFLAGQPDRREEWIERAFGVYWRAVR